MLGPVSISIPTLVVELVIFLLMVYAMQVLVFTPIREHWAERDRLIQEGLNASNEGRDEAEQAQQEVRRVLIEARQEAQRSIDSVTAEGNETRDELVSQATAEFRKQVDAARADISREREESAAALQGRIVDIALQAASSVTGQTYNEPRVRELAATVIQREGLQ
ncbi:MAG: ATP synthase F0 subunit B [Chloroflexota bacterium]